MDEWSRWSSVVASADRPGYSLGKASVRPASPGRHSMLWSAQARKGCRGRFSNRFSIANVISVGHSLTKGGKFTRTRPNKSRLTSLEVAGRDIATWLEKREHSRFELLRAQVREGPRECVVWVELSSCERRSAGL